MGCCTTRSQVRPTTASANNSAIEWKAYVGGGKVGWQYQGTLGKDRGTKRAVPTCCLKRTRPPVPLSHGQRQRAGRDVTDGPATNTLLRFTQHPSSKGAVPTKFSSAPECENKDRIYECDVNKYIVKYCVDISDFPRRSLTYRDAMLICEALWLMKYPAPSPSMPIKTLFLFLPLGLPFFKTSCSKWNHLPDYIPFFSFLHLSPPTQQGLLEGHHCYI